MQQHLLLFACGMCLLAVQRTLPSLSVVYKCQLIIMVIANVLRMARLV